MKNYMKNDNKTGNKPEQQADRQTNKLLTFVRAGNASTQASKAGPSLSKSMSFSKSSTKMIAWGFPIDTALTLNVFPLHSNVCSTTELPSKFGVNVVGTFVASKIGSPRSGNGMIMEID